ncbi:hypothetical protein EDC96DRAFT_531268 [Choanephora cucurbitarum]|nr:hypothetical protein EDC96DRAFT_531268 [Choanephora cucurbitarum]
MMLMALPLGRIMGMIIKAQHTILMEILATVLTTRIIKPQNHVRANRCAMLMVRLLMMQLIQFQVACLALFLAAAAREMDY